MNNIEFCDNQRVAKQEKFLKNLVENVDKLDSAMSVYSELASYGMTSEEKTKSELVESCYRTPYNLPSDKRKLMNDSVIFKNKIRAEYKEIYKKRLDWGDYFLYFDYSSIYPHSNLTPDIKIYMAPNFDKDQESYMSFMKNYLTFLKEEYVSHSSKVSSSMRADHLVTRVSMLDTAARIADFVNANADDNLFNENNPFLVNVGKLSLAFDQKESFNFLLSYYLYNYVISCRDLNILDTASIENFKIFVENHFQETIVNFVDFENFFDNENAPARIGRRSEPGVMANIAQSTIMLIKTLGKNFNIDDLRVLYDSMITDDYKKFVMNLKEKFTVCKENHYNQNTESENFSKEKVK